MMEISVTYHIDDEDEKVLQSIVDKYQKQGVHFTKESAFDFIMTTGSVYDMKSKMEFHKKMLDEQMSANQEVNYRKTISVNQTENGTKSAYNIVMDNRKELVDRLIQQMEKGYAQTRAAWSQDGLGRPYNPLSKAVYRGGNRFRLMIAAQEKGFKDPRWLTFKQASENNLKIKPGSKGVMLEKWIFYKEVPVLDEKQQPVLEENGKPIKELKQLEKPQVNYFWVFNGEQVEGLPELEKKTLTEDMYSKMADDFVRSSKCPIHFGIKDEAYYLSANDEIHMPAKESFKSNQARLAVQLHEMAHSTGHADRLNRPLKNSFGSIEYAKEELNAELSSIFLESELGIELETDSEALKDHSNYVKSWIAVLKDNPSELFSACNVAEKITDYLKKNYEQVLQQEQTKQQQTEVSIEQESEKVEEPLAEKKVTEPAIEDMVNEIYTHARNMFEGVVSDLEKTGIWGAWMGNVVNHNNPNEYFVLDMTGVERTQEILLDITCIKGSKMIAANSFSIKALDIWKTGTKAFDEQPIKDALAKALEIGKFTLNAENGRISFDIYSTLSGTESMEKHDLMLEKQGKCNYFDVIRIYGDISRCGFKPTESLVENIYKFSEMEGKHFTLRQLAALNKTKPDFSNDSKKAECFNSIIRECQEQEMARSQNPTHFMKQEMMMEITPTPGA